MFYFGLHARRPLAVQGFEQKPQGTDGKETTSTSEQERHR